MPVVFSLVNFGLRTVAFQQSTVSTTAVALPAAGESPKRAVITVHTNAIRYRLDGTNPSTTVGHLAPTGTVIELMGPTEIASFRMIRNAAADSEVAISIEA
jgi:hypothetical protein